MPPLRRTKPRRKAHRKNKAAAKPRRRLHQTAIVTTRRGKRQLPLTDRQYEVLRLVWQGKPNWEIGEQLQISRRTVEVHRAALMKRARVHNAAQLLRWAVFNKLVPAQPRKVA
jgi:DNA-binding CsgD family transcriptional regulator